MADAQGWLQVLAGDQSDQFRLDSGRQEDSVWVLSRCDLGHLPQPHGWRVIGRRNMVGLTRTKTKTIEIRATCRKICGQK